MSSKSLMDATPQLRVFASTLIMKAKQDLNLTIIVTSVSRTFNEQVALFAQGRVRLNEVNILRKKVDYKPIIQSENRIVTWTFLSKHVVWPGELSHAIDIVILDKNGKASWDVKADVNDDNLPDYIQVGALAKTIDPMVKWGGDFVDDKDYPHFQIT